MAGVLQNHAKAILDLLDADNTHPALVILDGAVPKEQLPPYTLVYFTATTPDGVRAPDKVSLDAHSDVIDLRAYVHSVAVNARAARNQADRARAALLNVTPVITGRVCFPIRHDDDQAPERDETTGGLVFDQIDVYRLVTLPA
jgi:hypothetical protein